MNVVSKKNFLKFAVFSLIASALNYLAYPVLSRILPTNEYIDVTVALSILTQIGTFMAALTAVTVGLTGASEKLTIMYLQNKIIQVFAVLSVVFLPLSPFVMSVIKIPPIYALPIALMILASIPITIASGHLNGMRLLSQLGLVALVSASFQFTAGVIGAIIFSNGIVSMVCMSIAQLLAILIIYRLFNAYDLPKLNQGVFCARNHTGDVRKLFFYTTLAAMCIMTLNLLQVIDLILIKNTGNTTAKLYTDIYTLSRVVFFIGMIFIWPFLGKVASSSMRQGLKELLKLAGIISGIGVISIVGVAIFGETIVHALFGISYPSDTLFSVSALSILYKVLLLLLTACGLLAITHRSYVILHITATSALLSIALLRMTSSDTMSSILLALITATFIALILSVFFIVLITRPKQHRALPEHLQ